MSLLAEALKDLSASGLLDRVVKLDIGKDRSTVEMLPQVAMQRPGKKLPGEAETEEDLLFASNGGGRG